MTPQDKAKELVSKFSQDAIRDYKCALIAVDEILHITCLKSLDYKKYFNDNTEFIGFWQEVKREIEKL